jgi:hypothetical protein
VPYWRNEKAVDFTHGTEYNSFLNLRTQLECRPFTQGSRRVTATYMICGTHSGTAAARLRSKLVSIHLSPVLVKEFRVPIFRAWPEIAACQSRLSGYNL